MSKTLNQVSEEAWDARDVVESLSVGIQHMAQFLNKFDIHCRHHLAKLDEKVSLLERKLTYLEARKTGILPVKVETQESFYAQLGEGGGEGEKDESAINALRGDLDE